MINKYMKYLKNNPDNYWFKRKLYGWGWVPVKWQGWVITFVYVLLVVLFGFTIDEKSSNREVFFTFILPATFLTITLIRIAYRKGEEPKWQWGLPKDK